MYSFSFGPDRVGFEEITDETSAPKVFACRFVPSTGVYGSLTGYGLTEGDAVVDLLRTRRDMKARSIGN